MHEDLRRKFERQRSAAIGSSARDPEAGQANPAKDILRASFERHAGERRAQHEQVEQTRKQRAMRYWQAASNESEEGK